MMFYKLNIFLVLLLLYEKRECMSQVSVVAGSFEFTENKHGIQESL